MRNQKLQLLIINSLFAVIIAILAQITIPLGIIPFTGQTLAVGLAATILGWKNGTIAILFYIFLGAIGLPVFQGATSGVGVLLSPTGGFLIGFIFNAAITGYMIEKTNFRPIPAAIANVIGAFVTLVFGTFWLAFQAHLTLHQAFLGGFIPFIIPGIVKAVLASYLGLLVRNRLAKAKLLPTALLK